MGHPLAVEKGAGEGIAGLRLGRMLTQLTDGEYDRTGKMPVAVLYLSIEELEIEHGIIFTRGVDDLDYFSWAALRTSSGNQFGLLKYGASAPGIAIFGDPRSPDLDDLATELGLPPSMFEQPGDV